MKLNKMPLLLLNPVPVNYRSAFSFSTPSPMAYIRHAFMWFPMTLCLIDLDVHWRIVWFISSARFINVFRIYTSLISHDTLLSSILKNDSHPSQMSLSHSNTVALVIPMVYEYNVTLSSGWYIILRSLFGMTNLIISFRFILWAAR